MRCKYNTIQCAVSIQYDENKEKQPIPFISRALNDREICYSVTEKQVLTLVWADDKLHIYLYGKHFHAFVDHQPLKHIFKKVAITFITKILPTNIKTI